MDVLFHKQGLEEILLSNIAHENINLENTINVRNNLFNLWKISRIEKIPEEKIFSGIDRRYVNFIKSNKDVYIPSHVSVTMFKNISETLDEGPEIFARFGYEAIMNNPLAKYILPYVHGRDINRLAENIVGMNIKKNKTKQFSVRHIHEPTSNSMRTILNVKPLLGISHPGEVSYWNVGIYEAIIELSSDKNVSTSYKVDENNGEIEYIVEHEPSRGNLIDLMMSPISNLLSSRSKHSIRENKNNAKLHQELMEKNIAAAYSGIEGMLTGIEAKHHGTLKHSWSTFYLSMLVGAQLGFDAKHMNKLGLSALFHDFGKIAVHEDILHKDGKFNDEEFEMMKIHPILSLYYAIKNGLDFQIAMTCAHHHETPLGEGYPFGINEKQISLYSAILNAVDQIDALKAPRIYRDPPEYSLSKVKYIFEDNVSAKRINPIIGEFILDNTFPVLEENGFSQSMLDIDNENITSSDFTDEMRRFIGFCIGHNSFYTPKKEVSPYLRKMVDNPQLTPFRDSPLIYQEIGFTLQKSYSKMQTNKMKGLFKRVTPTVFEKYLPDDGIKRI